MQVLVVVWGLDWQNTLIKIALNLIGCSIYGGCTKVHKVSIVVSIKTYFKVAILKFETFDIFFEKKLHITLITSVKGWKCIFEVIM